MSSTPARPRRPADQPGQATAHDGVVLLDGPMGVAITLTPKAARQTGANLQSAADLAEGAVAPDASTDRPVAPPPA